MSVQTGPIIDSHVHLWDTRLLRYPWLDCIASLNRPFLLEDYRAATASVSIESMIFVQCEVEPATAVAEAAWVEQLAQSEPRIKGMVAWAPLEKGRAVAADLERLKEHKILRGIRRIIQFEPDLDFCLRPDFIEGVRTLKDFDLSFDVCIDHRHMVNVLKFVEQIPDVPMILDHIGKPNIKDNALQPWASQIRELAGFPNVSCKISGIATEANHRSWTATQLEPYINAAIEAFGFDRIMYGSDWPVSTQAIAYGQWVSVLDGILSGVAASDLQKFWRNNAAQFYRI